MPREGVFARVLDVYKRQRVELVSPREDDPAEYAVVKAADGTCYSLTLAGAANLLGYVPEGDYARGNTESARIAWQALGELLQVSAEKAARMAMDLAMEKDVYKRQIYLLDTTQWHDYGLVVDDASETYDVYVDGEMVIPDASACTYKGGDLFRVGMDTEARGNMDVRAVRLGSGDLYEGNSEEEKPDGENPGEGKPEGENPEDKEWDILKHSFSPEWDSEDVYKRQP